MTELPRDTRAPVSVSRTVIRKMLLLAAVFLLLNTVRASVFAELPRDYESTLDAAIEWLSVFFPQLVYPALCLWAANAMRPIRLFSAVTLDKMLLIVLVGTILSALADIVSVARALSPYFPEFQFSLPDMIGTFEFALYSFAEVALLLFARLQLRGAATAQSLAEVESV